MTITKISENQKRWIMINQSAVFVSATVILLCLNFTHCFIQIKRPAVLLAGSVFAFFNFKNNSLSILQKIVLLYMIEMFFNQLCERVVHFGGFSIHLSLIVMVPLAVSFMCARFQRFNFPSIETNELFKSWGIAFVVVLFHMLFLMLLLKPIYGYGYEYDLGVFANVCLYFLVFLLCWQQLGNLALRRVTAMIFIVFFIVIIMKGF